MSNSRESSLTTPNDRDLENRWVPDQFAPPLEGEQLAEAVRGLNNTSFTNKFPMVDRTYADPAIPLQSIALVSFMPSKGASPDKNGIFGFAKIRGCFATELEANQRAEYIIRNVDSYNQIFHTYVGRPFPITLESKYAAELDQIDLKKEMAKTVSENIKTKKEDDHKVMQEIKKKEEELLADVQKEVEDPYDEYITQRVKQAQLSFVYLEHQKKMDEVREIIIKTRAKVKEMDELYPEYKDSYYDKYMEARKNAGIQESKMDSNANFIKYLVEDAPLDF